MSTLMSALGTARRSSSAALVVICVVGYLILVINSAGGQLQPASIRGFLAFLAVPVLIGLAQMVTLCVGQMNLAVGAMGGASAAVMAVLMQNHGVPTPLALLAGVAMSTAVGAINGLIVVTTKINGFIVTLATMSIMLGVQYKLVQTFTVDRYSPALKEFGNFAIGGVLPTVFCIAVVTAVAIALMFRHTVAGRQMLAYGDNASAAQLSGISEARVLIMAHALSGLLIGIAAVVSVASLSGINRSVGGDWLLASFAAPIIGGVVLTGGSVAVFGTVMAAVLVRIVDTAKAEFRLDPNWVPFIVGAVVLGAVLLATVRDRRAARRAGRSTR